MIEQGLSNKFIVEKLRKLADMIETDDLSVKALSVQDIDHEFCSIEAALELVTILPTTRGAMVELKIHNNVSL